MTPARKVAKQTRRDTTIFTDAGAKWDSEGGATCVHTSGCRRGYGGATDSTTQARVASAMAGICSAVRCCGDCTVFLSSEVRAQVQPSGMSTVCSAIRSNNCPSDISFTACAARSGARQRSSEEQGWPKSVPRSVESLVPVSSEQLPRFAAGSEVDASLCSSRQVVLGFVRLPASRESAVTLSWR